VNAGTCWWSPLLVRPRSPPRRRGRVYASLTPRRTTPRARLKRSSRSLIPPALGSVHDARREASKGFMDHRRTTCGATKTADTWVGAQRPSPAARTCGAVGRRALRAAWPPTYFFGVSDLKSPSTVMATLTYPPPSDPLAYARAIGVGYVQLPRRLVHGRTDVRGRISTRSYVTGTWPVRVPAPTTSPVSLSSSFTMFPTPSPAARVPANHHDPFSSRPYDKLTAVCAPRFVDERARTSPFYLPIRSTPGMNHVLAMGCRVASSEKLAAAPGEPLRRSVDAT